MQLLIANPNIAASLAENDAFHIYRNGIFRVCGKIVRIFFTRQFFVYEDLMFSVYSKSVPKRKKKQQMLIEHFVLKYRQKSELSLWCIGW